MDTVNVKPIAAPVEVPEPTEHGQRSSGHHPPAAPQPRGGKRFRGLLMGVIVVGGLLALGIAPRLQQEKKLQAITANINDTVIPVNVVHPIPAPASTNIVLPGSVQAIAETTINARMSGYLRRRYVDIGSRVRAGQVLADIEAPEVDQQLMQARAETSRTVAGGEQAIADVARLRANVAQARADLARANSNEESSRADLAHSAAKLQEAQSATLEAKAKLVQARKKLNGQKAELARAQTRQSLAEKTWKRWQELARGGAVSGQELDETQAAYESSQAGVTAAQADVESAEADVDAAEAAVHSREGDVSAAQADVNAARQKVQAAASGVRSSMANVTAIEASVQASQANVRASQATVQASEANVNRYNAMKSFEHVVAPFAGVITARNVDVGDLINAGSATNAVSDPTSTVPHTGLFGIARTDQLRIQVNVPQAYAGEIHVGQSAQVTIQEFPGRVFTGTVYDTAGALDANSRTLLAEIRLENPNNLLKPGTFAQIHFVLKNDRPLLRVPANTLIVDGSGIRVAVVTPDNKIHFKQVGLGRDFGKEVEITQGLQGTEQLVTDPTDTLQEQTPVHVVAASQ